jgi:hypothetical protein
MRYILLLLFAGVVISITSCTKSDSTTTSNVNYLMIADTGLYVIKTGTVTIVRPDTTFTYDASKDVITIYHKSKNTPDFWDIYCSNTKFGYSQITAIGAPTIGNATLSYSESFVNAPKWGYFLSSYTPTNAGTMTLSSYNTNGIAASGSFTSSVKKYTNGTSVSIGTTTMSGSFDLKLSPK